ncbi:hypothetical protein E4U53_008201 [Claviceps sorghi]|nr:hypothetical protein E4U53_008201 [Claviceps sorghi]
MDLPRLLYLAPPPHVRTDENLTVCVFGMVPTKFTMLGRGQRSMVASFNGHLRPEAPRGRRDIEIFLKTTDKGTVSYDSTTKDPFLEPFLACYLFARIHTLRRIKLKCRHEIILSHVIRLMARFPSGIPVEHERAPHPIHGFHCATLPQSMGRMPPLEDLFDQLTRFCDRSLMDERSEAIATDAGYYFIMIDLCMTAFEYLRPILNTHFGAQCLTNVIRACLKLRRYDSNRSLDSLLPGWRLYMIECTQDRLVDKEIRLRLLYFNALFTRKIQDLKAASWYAQSARDIAPDDGRFRQFLLEPSASRTRGLDRERL